MSEHAFEEGAISRCRHCNAVRARRGTSWVFAPPSGSPWTDAPTACVLPSYGRPWRDKTIVFFDTETTGLDWRASVITEVGLVRARLREGEVVIEDRYCSLVWTPPMFRQDAERTAAITGITLEMLGKAPHAGYVCAEVAGFMAAAGQDAVLASFNAAFDVPFLSSMFLRSGETLPSLLLSEVVLDPLIWSRKVDRYAKGGHKLVTVALRRGVVAEHEVDGAHRADFDAELGMRVLGSFSEEVPGDLEDLFHYQRIARAEWEANLFTYIAKQRKVGPSEDQG